MISNNESTNADVSYEWNLNHHPIYGVPMCSTLQGLLPTLSWLRKTLGTLVLATENVKLYVHLTFTSESYKKQIDDLDSRVITLENECSQPSASDNYDALFNDYIALVKDITEYLFALPSATRSSNSSEWGLEKYNLMFQSIPLPFVSTPEHLHNDRTFAYWRLAGNNPLLLKKISSIPDKFPVTDSHYKLVMGDNDSLDSALSENRVYLADYNIINKLATPDGFNKPETGVGYSEAPIALFAVSKTEKHLLPVAIQCGQDATQYDIITPSSDPELYWGWEMAKTSVQTADENHHEIITHLALTHLISEVYAVATLRNIRDSHPLYKLLISHYEGTNFINNGATKILLLPGQFIDKLFSQDLSIIYEEVLSGRFSFDVTENTFPNYIKSRGLDDIDALPDYPYRDDGLLIWEAIEQWVSDYVDFYYLSDDQVKLDPEIMAWSDDIVSNGKLYNFKPIDGVKALKDALTMAIFVASAQHAAVNFAQPEWMSYAPAMCGSHAVKAPNIQKGHSNSDWVNMQPQYNQALLKLTIYTLLGGTSHGLLGAYIKPGTENEPLFTDIHITTLLTKFRNRLLEIEDVITKRNLTRYIPYEYLLPSRIPASTNI
ncbi:AraC family transcriptional regulator [Enterobacter ludwigii]|uniref:lipoxygenase family protein n=1 Tax=Enterobacter ludwigii TaxID=299767 RepID=UPI003445D795